MSTMICPVDALTAPLVHQLDISWYSWYLQNNNVVPSGLGLRPERKLFWFRFFPPSFLFLSVSLFSTLTFTFLFRVYLVRIYHGRSVAGIISFQVYEMVYDSSLVPFPCVLVLWCTQYSVSFHKDALL